MTPARACAAAALLVSAGAWAASNASRPANQAASTPLPKEVAKEVREIPIDASRANKVYRVHTAPGYPAVVEFPEAFVGVPACGDCGAKGLYQIDVFAEGHYFAIKPRLYPGPQEDGSNITEDDFTTTVNVRLVSGMTLTIQMELSDKAKADARVVFTIPSRDRDNAYLGAQLATREKELKAKFQSRIDQGIAEGFLRALAVPHECANLSGRVRHDDIVVEAKELCRFGDTLYLRFTVENRANAGFEVGAVEVASGSSPSDSVDELQRYLPDAQVDFRKVVTGVVGFKTEAKDARSFQLTVSESGGRGRAVTLAGISF